MPNTYEIWLASHYADAEWAHGACDGCEATDQELIGGYCGRCLRYQFGYDEAQERTLTATIGGALRGALEEVDETELRAVVEEAFGAHHETQVSAALEAGAQ